MRSGVARRGRDWLGAAVDLTRRPAYAAALAAGIVAVVTVGMSAPVRRPSRRPVPSPVQFVLVAPEARSVAVVGDFNNWGLGDTALVAENHNGVWSVSAPVPAGRPSLRVPRERQAVGRRSNRASLGG